MCIDGLVGKFYFSLYSFLCNEFSSGKHGYCSSDTHGLIADLWLLMRFTPIHPIFRYRCVRHEGINSYKVSSNLFSNEISQIEVYCLGI